MDVIPGWRVDRPLRGRIQVLPVDDLVEHELEEGCVCGPTLELLPGVGLAGGEEWALVHHALDGREEPG